MGDSVTSTHALEKHRDREVNNVYRVRRHAPFASFILSSWVSWLTILEGAGHQNHRTSTFAIHYAPENERMSPEKEPLYKGNYIFQSVNIQVDIRWFSGGRGVYKFLPPQKMLFTVWTLQKLPQLGRRKEVGSSLIYSIVFLLANVKLSLKIRE